MLRRTSFALAVAASSVVFAQAIDPVLFVANNVGDNIKSFKVNADGTLTGIGTFATGDGPQTISLSPDGKYVAVGHGTASTTVEELRIFEVNANGTLTPRLNTTVPDSPLDVLWVNNTKLAVTKTSGPAQVRMFNWNAGASMLNEIDVESTGVFNASLATNGSTLYANDTGGGSNIRAFRVNGDGTLDLVDTQPTSPFFAVNVALTRNSQYLYGAGGISGDGNRILGYRVNADGSIDPTTPSDFTSPGESPNEFAFSEDGTRLFASHGTDSTIQSFTIDNVTGVITSTGFSYDVGGQGTLGETAVLGGYLFALDNSTSSDGRSGVISLRINADGSLTEVGIFPSDGGRPDYVQVWRGIPEPTSAMMIGLGAALVSARRARR